MGLEKETIGFLIVGGLILAAILFVEESSANEIHAYAVAIHPIPLILRHHDKPDHHFPNTGEWNELVECKHCGYKWRRAPLLMGGDGGGVSGE